MESFVLKNLRRSPNNLLTRSMPKLKSRQIIHTALTILLSLPNKLYHEVLVHTLYYDPACGADNFEQ